MATYSSILAWGIPMDRGAQPGGLQSMVSKRVGHDSATKHRAHVRACSRAHAHTHTHIYVQPNHFAIHPKLILCCKSTTLQSENKACICLTLKLYTLLYILHKNKDDYRCLTVPALSRDSCQVQCWPHQEDADPAELSRNSIRKRGCYHPWLPAHKPSPNLCWLRQRMHHLGHKRNTVKKYRVC